MKVLVTGATGGVGRGVLEGLLEKDVAVRALSRQSAKLQVPPGVEKTIGDLNEPATLNRAFEGISAVFLYAQGGNLSELMKRMKGAGVEYVVFLSTIDAANEQEYAQHNRRRHVAVEEAISNAGFRYTFLRPGAFATNALRFWRRSIVEESVVRIPFPEAQQAPIDERDIAAVAVNAFVLHQLDGQAIVLTGPQSLSQRQQVACISDVVRRPIRIETISEEQTRAWLATIIPPGYVNLLFSQWRDEVGVSAQVTEFVEHLTGRPATPYRTWVERNAEAFRNS
jgi:uncharacterized protein YbjT (DUF2867 family)